MTGANPLRGRRVASEYALGVNPWLRTAAAVALVLLVAGAGILANFELLRLTSDAQDPVGKLSPRSLAGQTGTATVPRPVEVPADADDGSPSGQDRDD